MSITEFFRLFQKPAEDTRWLDSADSQDYLAVVTYLAMDPLKTRQ